MSDPTTVNQTATVVNDVIKAIIEGAGVTEVEAIAVAEAPWLALPFVHWIFMLGLNWVAKYFYTSAANAATKIVIDVQVNIEKSKVLNSFQELQQAIASGDNDAIALASKDLSSAYGSLIHSDGAAPA